MRRSLLLVPLTVCLLASRSSAAEPKIDFNRDVRPILSNNCFFCHGPDEKERKGGSNGLRLDTADGFFEDLGGHTAVVKGKPDDSELIKRVISTDNDTVMPPAKSGKKLSVKEVEILKQWIAQGAPFSRHWSYEKPIKPNVPAVATNAPVRNAIDNFIQARLAKEGLKPSVEADKNALIRRVSLDLIGLPPTPAEVDEFVSDKSADAYEKLVDRILAKSAYGEHWARQWLDVARYADSAGYADDPPRTIWAYRDWVIKAFNRNLPFDQFTIEQVAGDLLPNPTEDQLVATAFHRNTQTNSEGGTNDEEFRNVAIVDRVNTTMATWMGTTIACAQCHSHKYDPISQKEFFQLFAILNNTEDADRRDESPLLTFYSESDKQRRTALEAELAASETKLKTATPELLAAQNKWEASFPRELTWLTPKPSAATSTSGATLTVDDAGNVLASEAKPTDTFRIDLPLDGKKLSAIRLDALPHDTLPGKGPGLAGGNFVVSQITASIAPPESSKLSGQFVRVSLPGNTHLMLAEVQIFNGTENVALKGEATQSSVDYEGPAKLANDGNTNGHYFEGKSVTHTKLENNPWWEVDLKSAQPIDRIAIWNRTDGGIGNKLVGAKIEVLNADRKVVFEDTIKTAPNPSREMSPTGARSVKLVSAFADYTQTQFDANDVLVKDGKPKDKTKGWAVGGKIGQPSSLTLIAEALEITPGSKLTVSIEHSSQHEKHILGHFRLSVTDDARTAEFARTPANIVALVKKPAEQRSDADRTTLTEYFLTTVAAEQQPLRNQIADIKKQLAGIQAVTVPIQRELAADKRRKTRVQLRGDFMNLADEVSEGVPAAFHPLPDGAKPDRLTLATWLLDSNNPLTSRVTVNRYWEKLFGNGIVLTAEEFGSQGDLPSHPELLDWLAVEFQTTLNWDMKKLLKLLVTSHAYRQSSKVTPELLERDIDNRLLARGPRFRVTAEIVRDQALFVAGLLSPKMYGMPVKPYQPALGVSAAFGSGIDWSKSDGEDQYRRGIYTNWRRSNPYPSMATFDAPTREACILRRPRTNTPLQALVTLNDPVYIEASQALARRLIKEGGATPTDRVRYAFKVCLARDPSESELNRLVKLQAQAKEQFAAKPTEAASIATKPIGPAPQGVEVPDLAAWTIVSNVMLNLDEMFMSR